MASWQLRENGYTLETTLKKCQWATTRNIFLKNSLNKTDLNRELIEFMKRRITPPLGLPTGDR